MKCPKCQYIGFDDGNRCRNCGYEFSLAADDTPLDVAIGREEPAGGRPFELALRAGDTDPIPDFPAEAAPPPRPARPAGAGAARRPLTAEDLPLFLEGVPDDQAPLVTPPAVPRPPLAVRRAPPAGGRHRAHSDAPDELPLDLVPDREARRADAPRSGPRDRASAEEAAPAGQRLLAGVIDVAVLGAIGAAVLYLTVRLADLQFGDWAALPLVPLGAFLLLLCGGYFVLFTAAGGQTIGKMIARVRVVSVAAGNRDTRGVPFSAAAVRAVALLGSVAAAGTGFLPVLFSSDRRAFHDRVADTRVVSV